MNVRVTTTVEILDHHAHRGEVVVASATLTDELPVGIVGAAPDLMGTHIRATGLKAGNTAMVGALRGATEAWEHRATALEDR